MSQSLAYNISFDASQAQQALASFNDQVSRAVRGDAFAGINRSAKDAAQGISGLSGSLLSFSNIAKAAAGAFAKASIDSSKQAAAAFRGLESVANRTGAGIEKAWAAVTKLTKDGVLTQTQAAASLKNLLSFGLDADQAVEVIDRVKDAAAFGRQSALEWGEAVVSATEGIRNENSALVDNAGITKNVAKIYEEYADSIGVTYNSLTQAQKVTALYNGVMKETETQAGDTAKALAGSEGASAQLAKAYDELKTQIGSELEPAFAALQVAGAGVIDAVFKPMVGIAGALVKTFAGVTGMVVDVVQAFKKAESLKEFDAEIRARTKAQAGSIAYSLGKGLGLSVPPPPPATSAIPALSTNTTGIKVVGADGKPLMGPTEGTARVQDNIDTKAVERKAQERAAAEAKIKAKQALADREKELGYAKQVSDDQLNIYRAGLDAQRAALDDALARGTVSRTAYARKAAELEQQELLRGEAERVKRVAALQEAVVLARTAGDKDKEQDLLAAISREESLALASAEKLKAVRIKAGTEVFEAAQQQAAELANIDEQLMRARWQAEAIASDAALDRELSAAQSMYDEKLITEQEYQQKVAAIRDRAFAENIARLEAELAYANRRAASASSSESGQDRARAVQLEAQIKATEEKRAQLHDESESRIRQAAIETARLRKQLEIDLLEAEGQAFEARSAMIDQWLEARRRELVGMPELLAMAERVAGSQKREARFQSDLDGVAGVDADYARMQSDIDRRQRTGLLDDIAYERESLALKKQQAAALRERLELLKQSADGVAGAAPAIAELETRIADLDSAFSETAQEINDSFFERIQQGFYDLLSGARSFGDVLKSILADTLSQIAALFLKAGLQQVFAGLGMTGGGGLGGAVMSMFGGFRAAGGDVSGSKAYVVGEVGPELFFPGASGRVVSNADIQRAVGLVSPTAAAPRYTAPQFSGGGSTTVQNSISPNVVISTAQLIEGLKADPAFERYATEVVVRNGTRIRSAWG